MEEDDEYGYYFDELDEDNESIPNCQCQMFLKKMPAQIPIKNISWRTIEEEKEEDKETSMLQKLTGDVMLNCILPYLSEKNELSKLTEVSKYFKNILYSTQAERLWNADSNKPFEFCIDTYCSICSIKKRQQKGNINGVLGFFRKCPINKLKLHCFVEDIPSCLVALATTHTLNALALILTNKSSSPPLEDILGLSTYFRLISNNKLYNHHNNNNNIYNSDHNENNNNNNLSQNKTDITNNYENKESKNKKPLIFSELKELTLESSNLQHINLSGRSLLLDILGFSLESLSFSGLSPSGVFSILSARCPNLKKLRMDRVPATGAQDILTYHSKNLEELELHRANFLLYPGCLRNLPSLNSLKFTPSFRCDSAQMEGVINCLPAVLQHLSLEISSQTGDDILLAVGKRLPLLLSLTIMSSHEQGMLSKEVLLNLSRKCLYLSFFDLSSMKSVSDMTLNEDAYLMFASFPSLTKLRVKYDDAAINYLSKLLTQSDSLRNVTLWERRKWISEKKWDKMERKISSVSAQYPKCKLRLEAIR